LTESHYRLREEHKHHKSEREIKQAEKKWEEKEILTLTSVKSREHLLCLLSPYQLHQA
jgi:hypothetical protein